MSEQIKRAAFDLATANGSREMTFERFCDALEYLGGVGKEKAFKKLIKKHTELKWHAKGLAKALAEQRRRDKNGVVSSPTSL